MIPGLKYNKHLILGIAGPWLFPSQNPALGIKTSVRTAGFNNPVDWAQNEVQ
jgi:hypothetical protein